MQELTGTTPKANLIAGGIDEVFLRKETSVTRHPMTDALGSVIALTDAAGAMATEYTFEPYGNTTTSGAADTNSQSYTARENDGTGLYYYRARYYSPHHGRFTSEDPVGWKSGQSSAYAYVSGNPLRYRDPNGLTQQDIDNMLELAGITQPDLKVPDAVGIGDTRNYRGDPTYGHYNPFTDGITLNQRYLEKLDCAGLENLFEIIVHESIHRTNPLDAILRPINHGDIVDDAKRRTRDAMNFIKGFCACP